MGGLLETDKGSMLLCPSHAPHRLPTFLPRRSKRLQNFFSKKATPPLWGRVWSTAPRVLWLPVIVSPSLAHECEWVSALRRAPPLAISSKNAVGALVHVSTMRCPTHRLPRSQFFRKSGLQEGFTAAVRFEPWTRFHRRLSLYRIRPVCGILPSRTRHASVTL